MPADVSTKPVGPASFEDLVNIMGLHCPHLSAQKGLPNPKVAALKTGMTHLLIALMLFNQATEARAQPSRHESINDVADKLFAGFVYGFGGYIGWHLAGFVQKGIKAVLCHRRPMTNSPAPVEFVHRPTPMAVPINQASEADSDNLLTPDEGRLELPSHVTHLDVAQLLGLEPQIVDGFAHEDISATSSGLARRQGETRNQEERLDLPHSGEANTRRGTTPHVDPLLESDQASEGSEAIDAVPHRP